ncbi:MAG: DUF5908 family protein [Bacteroidota bacterium]
MPIEIRELVIKTEIKTVHENLNTKRSAYDSSKLKNEVLESCRRMISEAQKREKYNRR